MSFNLDEYLSDLRYLVNIDSGRGCPEGALGVARFFEERYRALGLATEIRYDGEDRESPFFTASNRTGGRFDLLLAAHMDTVFPAGTAKARPFSIDEEGRGRGPGIIDCKGGCLLIYYILRDFLAEGRANFSFCVAMNSDEETGSLRSRAFFEELADRSDRCFLFEPGRARGEFVSRRKGGNNYTVSCKGIPAHSGVDPEKGASAILELSRWIPILYGKFFRPADDVIINVGKFTGGGDGGAVPDRASFTVSMRAMSREDIEEADDFIRSMPERPFDSRCKITVESRPSRPVMTPDDRANRLISVFEAAGLELGQPVE
ncbi:MAG: M20/M25/M40 family metallo-hydrolase, partial [Clostridia bacterium]|nr:M20/M25/M40 family metallo-hydrolase [Clostridia bacterium]